MVLPGVYPEVPSVLYFYLLTSVKRSKSLFVEHQF